MYETDRYLQTVAGARSCLRSFPRGTPTASSNKTAARGFLSQVRSQLDESDGP